MSFIHPSLLPLPLLITLPLSPSLAQGQTLTVSIPPHTPSHAGQYSVFSNCSSTVTVSLSGPPGLFKGVTTAMSGVLARFPWLLPVRNPVAGYGASAVTRTPGPRTCGRSEKNQFCRVSGSQSGLPKKPFINIGDKNRPLYRYPS